MALRMSSYLGLFSIGGRLPFLFEASHTQNQDQISSIKRFMGTPRSFFSFKVLLDSQKIVILLTSKRLLKRIVGIRTRCNLICIKGTHVKFLNELSGHLPQLGRRTGRDSLLACLPTFCVNELI